MKKTVVCLIFIGLFFSISSCQSYRRGVQFYSGDKRSSVIEDQMSLTQEKRSQYELKLTELEKERELILSDQCSEQIEIVNEKIRQINVFLLDLQLAEDQMLIRMNYKDNFDYFQGNIRNGYEAANAYMLMKWAQEDYSTENSGSIGDLPALIINEWHRGVTAKIRHQSGLQLPDIPLDPKSSTVINLPFPGQYICYFVRGQQSGGTVMKNVNPRLLVNMDGEQYAFVLIQRGW